MKKVFLDDLPKKGIGKSVNWSLSLGYVIDFVYEDVEDKFYIVDYYRENGRSFLKIKYNNKISHIDISNFKAARLGNILGRMTYEYKYQVGNIIDDVHSGKLQILEQIKMSNGRDSEQKGYKYKCLMCGNIDTISESNLNRLTGCNVCTNNPQKILIGYNDMWTTNSNLALLLYNPEDGYKYTEHSDHRLDWKCPNCGYIIKNKKIDDISKKGLSCPRCSDGVSYPNKFIFSMLQQLLSNKFENEKVFNWATDKRYDFYFEINNNEYIIEAHGRQHYQDSGFKNCGGRTLEEEQLNDKSKKELAIKNKINEENYIVIDCRESNLEWIKNNILNSKLVDIFDLSNIDWSKCNKYACNSLVKQACDLWNRGIHSTKEIGGIMKLNKNTICSYLKRGTKSRLCDYNPVEVMEKVYKKLSIKNTN